MVLKRKSNLIMILILILVSTISVISVSADEVQDSAIVDLVLFLNDDGFDETEKLIYIGTELRLYLENGYNATVEFSVPELDEEFALSNMLHFVLGPYEQKMEIFKIKAFGEYTIINNLTDDSFLLTTKYYRSQYIWQSPMMLSLGALTLFAVAMGISLLTVMVKQKTKNTRLEQELKLQKNEPLFMGSAVELNAPDVLETLYKTYQIRTVPTTEKDIEKYLEHTTGFWIDQVLDGDPFSIELYVAIQNLIAANSLKDIRIEKLVSQINTLETKLRVAENEAEQLDEMLADGSNVMISDALPTPGTRKESFWSKYKGIIISIGVIIVVGIIAGIMIYIFNQNPTFTGVP